MELGCFNRPWTGCELDRALAGIAGAGFAYCGFLRHKGQPIVSAAATEAETGAVQALTQRLGLRVRCNLVGLALTEPPDTALERLRAEIDRASELGIPHLLTTGASDPIR